MGAWPKRVRGPKAKQQSTRVLASVAQIAEENLNRTR
jgi:hypothetical protein